MFYSEDEARRLVIEAGHRLLENKLIARTWGNISARIGADEFVITPSGRGYDTLEPEELVIVKISDCSYEGDIRPSSEKMVHAAAYALRDNVNFIIHTHQYYASALAAECSDVSLSKNWRSWDGDTEIDDSADAVNSSAENSYADAGASAVAAECSDVTVGDGWKSWDGDTEIDDTAGSVRSDSGARVIPCAEYALPGTAGLRKNVEAKLIEYPECDAILMARHGTLILAENMEEAFTRAEELEEKCRHLVEARVPSHDVYRAGKIDVNAIRCEVFPCVVVVNDPYIMECCYAGVSLGAYIDDFAQIAGPDIDVVENDPWVIQRTLLGYSTGGINGLIRKVSEIGSGNEDRGSDSFGGRGAKSGRGSASLRSGAGSPVPLTGALNRRGGMHPALNSLIGRNAVLVKGVGAVCAGKTQDDAEAIAMIVSKNCAAACYVRHASPLSPLDARLQRYIYLTKYSRLKNSGK